MAVTKAISAHELQSIKFDLLEFTGKWAKMMGQPEKNGCIFVWADSGAGKTTFVLQLVKYISEFSKVLYNSLEEGRCRTQQIAWQEANISESANSVMLLDKEPMSDLKTRLLRKRSPNVVVLDSWQYMRMSFRQWYDFKSLFPNKLFIVISQAEGKLPKGKSADAVRYDSPVKIFLDKYIAFPKSRYGGNTPYVLWEEKARECHGDAIVDNILDRYVYE